MNDRESRVKLLHEAARERVLVIGGPYGTYIHGRDLTPDDYGGALYDGCPEQLNVTRPDVIEDAHRGYLDAGADIITHQHLRRRLHRPRRVLACRTASSSSTKPPLGSPARSPMRTPPRSEPRFVGGNLGPTTKSLTITGGITFDEMIVVYHDWAAGLVAGGVDLLILETQNDTRTIKAALIGIERLFDEVGFRLPVVVSATIELTGTMLAGQSTEALATSLMHADLFALGLNCSTGPEFMTDHLRGLADITEFGTCVWPNAGLPDEDGNYCESPQQMAAVLERFLDNGWLNIIGGCCGTSFEHTRAFAELAARKKPRVAPKHSRALFSGIDFLEATDDNRPLIVGERTNEVGSRKFKRLITQEKYEEATRDRAPAGEGRRADHRRQPAERRPRRDRRHRRVLRAADQEDPRADHGRHHGSGLGRALAAVLPGQVDHQLHQPRGRARQVRARRAHRATATARRSSSAASTRTRSRRRRSRASASSRSRSVRGSC